MRVSHLCFFVCAPSTNSFYFFSYGRGLTDKQLARDTIGRARQSKKRAKDDIEDEDF